jgi:hypothetical protein
MSSTTPFTERAALDAVMAAERAPGRDPVQLPPGHAGYDIESRTADGSLLFIKVKGRACGAQTFTLTRTEIGIGGLPSDVTSVSLPWGSWFGRGEVPA